MKIWNKFWENFDNLFQLLPLAIEDFKRDGDPSSSVVEINNNNIEIHGTFQSLKINGYKVKVPDKVLRGKE